MLSCCCRSCVTRAVVWREMRKSCSADEDHSSMDIRTDIALLKEQYNSIRDKQRRETCVLCFKKEVNNEETCSKHLVEMVPVPQIQQTALSDASVLETQFEDSDNGLWRTHLDVYRMTHTSTATEYITYYTSDCSDVTDADAVSTDDSSTNLSEYLSQDHHHNNSMSMTSRKFSSSAVLSRQLSIRSYQSSPTPAGSKYYPFPLMKCLKKSETARSLGLYSSF